MNYVANPVKVKAHKIVKVYDDEEKGLYLDLDCGLHVLATHDMTARHVPSVGDYWVIQEDGYMYLNPKAVFERKYSPCEDVQ